MAGSTYKHVSKYVAAMPSLRQCEREYFRQHRFIGLPHGVVAAGPAGLALSVAWRLSLDLTNLLTWGLPVAAFFISYAILCRAMPSRDELRARAVCHLLELLSEPIEAEVEAERTSARGTTEESVQSGKFALQFKSAS